MTDSTPREPGSSADARFLNADTAMDAVTLHVGDLETMSSYYSDALVMEPIEERAHGREVHRVLGRGSTPMVRLISTPGLPPVDPNKPGLFHTAFLFEDQASLAATVYRAAEHPRSRFVGSADHLVSEAFYFTDPEGNGIELYTDRDRSQWTYVDGRVQMATLRLDPNKYLRDHLDEAVVAAGPRRAGKVGHVHLQVGDIETARAFYVDAIGFESTVEDYPGALFAAAGGYHHHVAMNIWNSAGSGPRASTLGLGDVAVTVPTRESIDALIARLKEQKLEYADTRRSVVLHDPWGTQLTVALPGTTTDELLDR